MGENEIDIYNFVGKINSTEVHLFVKTNLEAKLYNLFDSLNQEEHFEASIIELTQFNTIIICVYRTPNSNINCNIFIETMGTILRKLINEGKSIIIVGDLNIDFLGRSVNLQLQTMFNSCGLQAVVDVPTRIGSRSQTAIDN
jgi:exonuclease III